ncbi:hypothetical protein BBD42_04870 [Paenibacillus sp. BIHB 4019]|uniref:Inhibitor I9 domain-containing protein n=1 Tax=Paenibacillus sp. BIHB 4019 TaxID=1870819 RepID=A0A1B2DDU7_9BACL|nr:hypothetical protein [Paenibacillus sp. BIHB 4019]ANY65873.1 hypothetical protein BBD42_04870 [Paenibacillus sp. BIHB 4019]
MKKIISLVLTISLFFVAATSAIGAESSKTQLNIAPQIPTEGITKGYLIEFSNSFTNEYLIENPEFADTLEELKKLLKTSETDVKLIEQQLIQTEAMRKLAVKLGDTETATLSVMSTPESQEQFNRIDALAQEYYEQYKLTGILPETEFNSSEAAVLAGSNSSELFVLAASDREWGNDGVYSINTGDAVVALSTVGIVETEARLAARLVTLGALSAIDGPLPVADLICLVVGISLLWHYTATKVSTHSTVISNQIGTYYNSTAKANASRVAIGAATITAQIRQGYNHFVAFRNNVRPGGYY